MISACKETSGWRNRQTRTFEGRMVHPCEFKSHPRHQKGSRLYNLEPFQLNPTKSE